jgi:hypothetical protein
MSMRRHLLLPILPSATILGLAACLSIAVARVGPAQEAAKAEAPSVGWLRGTWNFDEDYTAKKHKESKDDEGLGGLVAGQLVAGLKGAKIKVTDKEVIMTTKDGNGQAERYEVLEVPDAETLTLKEAKGKVTTYHKEGDRFWIASTGSIRVPFYFKKEK